MLASVALISTGPWPRSGPITPSAKITSRRTEGKREAKLSDVQANQNLQAAPEGAPLGCKPLHGPAQGCSASGDRGADFRGPGDAMSDRKENAKTPAGAPVMKAASSLVRNDTVPTRSAGTSGRLIACMEAAWRYSSSMLAMPARGARALIVLAATMWAAPPNAANDTAVPIATEAIYRAQHLNLF